MIEAVKIKRCSHCKRILSYLSESRYSVKLKFCDKICKDDYECSKNYKDYRFYRMLAREYFTQAEWREYMRSLKKFNAKKSEKGKKIFNHKEFDTILIID